MRIAISTDGGFVSAHFGRCPVFTLVDIIDGKIENQYRIDNPGHEPGYIPQYLNEKDVNCIVCGGIGARAQGFFQEYNIKILAGVSGTIDEAVKKLQEGILEGGQSFCKPGAGRGYGIEKTECDHSDEEE